MKPKYVRHFIKFIVVALLLIIAWIMDYSDHTPYALLNSLMDVFRISIYIGILSAWTISIQRRITVTKIRHFILNSVGFVFLWFFLRCMRYYAFDTESVFYNLCWYGYYFSMMGIAVHVYFMSLYLGREPEYRVSKLSYLTLIPSVVTAVLVMTNDYHHLVFVITEDGSTQYMAGYFLFTAWTIILIILSFIHIGRAYGTKNSIRKFIWPTLIVLCGLLYLVLNYLNVPVFTDMEFTICMNAVIVLTFESLIQTGLIPSNTEFEWCLKNSSLMVAIADEDFNVKMASQNSLALSQETFARLRAHIPLMADENTEMFMADIHGGYVVWERDVTTEQEIIRELDSIRTGIEDASKVLRDNIDAEGLQHELKERNRLYDLIINAIDYKISAMEDELNLILTADGAEQKRLIRRLNLEGVYVKRKSNLILVQEMKTVDLGRELKLCFKETFDNLQRGGINADFMFREIPVIGIDVALIIYDLLETLIEAFLYNMTGFIAIVTDAVSASTLTINVTLANMKGQDFPEHSLDKWRAIIEDNYDGSLIMETDDSECSMFVNLPKGGGRNAL